jgi:hypothetical protein
MNLDTILKLLYRNNLDSVITRAIQLDNDIPFNHSIDEELVVEVSRTELNKAGMKFKGDSYNGYMKCVIVGIDKYDLDKPYIVRLPDGSVKKTVGNSDRGSVTETEVLILPQETQSVLK